MEQDWKPIILRGATRNDAKMTTFSSFTTHHEAKLRKLESGDELTEKKIPSTVRTAIQKKRVEMGWSQKQLATHVNEPEHVIKDIECGKLASPNPKLVLKLKLRLNINIYLI